MTRNLPRASHGLFILPFNILFTTKTDLYLLQDLKIAPFHNFKYAQLNHHKIRCPYPTGNGTFAMERTNMIHSIPELSLVIVGNQAGRVALVTMTYWPKRGRDFVQADRRCGFKIETVLPTRSERESHVCSQLPLLGIAVSPIQGHEENHPLRVGPRRYRLLMTYYCHTLLSYEIYRETPYSELHVI